MGRFVDLFRPLDFANCYAKQLDHSEFLRWESSLIRIFFLRQNFIDSVYIRVLN